MKPSKSDILILGLVTAVLISASYLLFREFNTTDASTGKKIGELTFKFRDVARKPGSGVVWNELSKDSFVYNNDSVKTEGNSEAILHLINGSTVEMDEKTLIVIYVESDGSYGLKLEQGSILIRKNNNKKNMKLITPSGGMELENGVFRISSEANGLEISSNGEGKIYDKNFDKTVKVKDNINASIINNHIELLKYIQLSPPDNAHFFPIGSHQNVVFSWDVKGATLQIAKDRFFKNTIYKSEIKTSEKSYDLPQGMYYWRIINAEGKHSQFQKIHIVNEEKTAVISPDDNTVFSDDLEESLIDFSWSNNPYAEYYEIVISKNQDLSDPVYDKMIYRNGISVPLLKGKYFWKLTTFRNGTSVTVEGPRTLSVSRAPAENITFESNTDSDSKEKVSNSSSSKVKELKKEIPIFLNPSPHELIDMSSRESLFFQWKPVNQAENYHFRLYKLFESPDNLIFETETEKPQFIFTKLSLLDIGEFVCTVEVLKGGSVESSAKAEFKISLSEHLDAPGSIEKKKRKKP